MFKNYLKIAWRNLLKNKGFSLINIVGLSIGLGCFVIIAMYVFDELSYDRHNDYADRIYRVHSDIKMGGTELSMAVSSDPMGETLKKDYPEVEEFVRFYNSNGAKLIKKDGQFIKEEKVTHADSTLFKVFTLPSILGNTKTALSKPNTVVLTRSAAERHFGNVHNAIGQTIETDDNQKTVYTVTAVIEDLPQNTHFDFEFFFSMDTINYRFGNFLSHNFHTYLLLRQGVDYKAFNKNFESVINMHVLPQASAFMQIKSMQEFENAGNRLEYSLMPLTDIHLLSSRGVELGVNGSMKYVYIFSIAAIFVLLIACINFVNLTTAHSSGRAKEVGIRKVLGTSKKYLVRQFLIESTLIAYVALLFGVILTWISLDWFNGISGKEMQISSLLKPHYLISLLLLPLVVGTLAGSYPALFLSSFRPIAVLKGKLVAGNSKNGLRNFLVVFQFATSIVLIVGTIVIYKQLRHIQNTQVGFDKEHVLVVENSGLSPELRRTVKSEAEKLNGIKSASFAGYLPVSSSSRSDSSFSTETVMTESNAFNMQHWSIDYDYIPNLGMELVQGRNFSPSFGTDSTAIIINESAVKLSGFKNPIGKKLYTADREGNPLSYTIIGVVQNFNFASLRKNVGPVSLRLGNNSWVTAYRMRTSDVAGMVSTIERMYKKAAPEMPFEYAFLDDSFDRMYRQEQRVGKVVLTFAVIAILIACLGLFGLVTYIAEQRTKEIGIRKVLGASVSNLVAMLSKDFMRLVVVSFAIAVPIAWWMMNDWLKGFAFRINLSWEIFALTGITAASIAVLTLSFRAVKAAMVNPTISLKAE